MQPNRFPNQPYPGVPKNMQGNPSHIENSGIYRMPIHGVNHDPYSNPICAASNIQQPPTYYFKGNKNKYYHMGPCVPSLVLFPCSSIEFDVNMIKKAYDGIGCDQISLISLLTHRSSESRSKIVNAYQCRHKKCLIKRTEWELINPMERCIVSLLYTGPDTDAYILRMATKGIGTDEGALREILCTRSSDQIKLIKESYSRMYQADLEKHIISDTSGPFCKILITLLNNIRSKDTAVDYQKAQTLATEIYTRQSILSYAPENLIQLFCETNYNQLIAIFEAFFNLTRMTMYTYLKKYIQGEYEKTLMTIYSYSVNPLHYYSKTLRNALATNQLYGVIRIVVTRCEIDLGSIMYDYQMMYCSDPCKDIYNKFQLQYPMVVTALLSLMGRY